MKITKYGHCCLLIEVKGKRILTDPGSYSEIPALSNIDIVLITHEHGDHLHVESLKKILKDNPKAKVITNTSVGNIIEKEGISFEVVADGDTHSSLGILIEGLGKKHEEIYKEIGQVENTGYFIENKLFYPGDAFYNPKKPVEILAVPVVGPWMKISQAIEYALEIKPRVCFPVHDGILKHPVLVQRAPSIVLPQNGIEFRVLEYGKETQF